jgi:hypothetical protein
MFITLVSGEIFWRLIRKFQKEFLDRKFKKSLLYFYFSTLWFREQTTPGFETSSIPNNVGCIKGYVIVAAQRQKFRWTA